jgi:hypothetical protein
MTKCWQISSGKRDYKYGLSGKREKTKRDMHPKVQGSFTPTPTVPEMVGVKEAGETSDGSGANHRDD